MALTAESLRFVRAGLEAVQRSGCKSRAVLSLGYPDIWARPRSSPSCSAPIKFVRNPELKG